MVDRLPDRPAPAAPEAPAFPGSPYIATHAPGRRAAYAAIAVLAGIGATFGNGMVNVNIASLAGGQGLYTAEASLLPAVYVGFNACANLILVKARAQFGIPQVTLTLLATYALAALLHLCVPGLAGAIVVRAACGLAAAALTTTTIYHLLQVFSLKARPLALVVGVSLPQFGPPLARLMSLDFLAESQWQGLLLTELCIALVLLGAMTLVPLPPSERSQAFEGMDLVTISLLVPAGLLLSAVLGLGRILWWTDTPWLGLALASALVLAGAAWMIERQRARPLLQLRWMLTGDIVRFAMVAFLVRIALAEQTYGAVGLLSAGGLNNDQLHGLFLAVTAAMFLGIIVAALTLSERNLPWQVAVAALCIALAAWLDSGSNSLTRPPQLMLSQSLVAFGTTLFVGPTLVFGFLRMSARGGDHLVSFIVLFSVSQNIGGLAGSALLGSVQTIMAKVHAQVMSERLLASDPQTAARLAQGSGALMQSLMTEANTLAYNDVFRLVALAALAVAAYLACETWSRQRAARQRLEYAA